MGDFASQHHSLTLFLLWSKHGQLMGCVALCQLISSTSWNSVRRGIFTGTAGVALGPPFQSFTGPRKDETS